jgi:hypothetical protein
MARAANRLFESDEDDDDLRVPIALACVELLGEELSDDELVDFVEALLPIEQLELDPREHIARAARANHP